jgi:tetratricopeptide (TPR) repeat protein
MKPAPAKGARHRVKDSAFREKKSSRPKWSILALACLAAVGGWIAWHLLGDGDRRQGMRLAEQQRFADAHSYLQRALDRHPGDVEVLKALVEGELTTNQPEAAEQSLTRWCELRPRDVEPYKKRLDLRLQRRQFPQALEDGQRILAIDPNNQEVGRLVVPMLIITGQLEEAEGQCRHWLLRDPDNAELLQMLADICHQRGNNTEAASLLDRLLLRQPDSSMALLLRAMVYEEQDEPAKAVPLLERVEALDPRISQQLAARYYRGLALARTGNRAEAQKVMAEVQWFQARDLLNRREHPKAPGLMVRVAEAMLGVSQAEEAVRLLKDLPDQDPNCLPEAIRLLEIAIAREPNYAAARQLLDSFYKKRDERKRGEK